MNNTDQRSNSISSAFDFDDRQYKPVLKPVSPSCSGDSYSHTSDESITKVQRQVTLTKSSDVGFGFNIIGGIMREEIYVSFILAGGAADVSKKLFKGDQILKVNGQDISQCSHRAVVQLLKSCSNKVHLTVIYKPEEFRSCENHLQEFDDIMQSSGNNSHLSSSYNTIGSLRTTSKKTLYVRTLFSYDVSKDCGLPNKGLSFEFGEILHVTNASDPEWWQARKVNLKSGEDDTDLGIIPSKQRVERKNRSKQRKVRICCTDDLMGLSSTNSPEMIGQANSNNSIGPPISDSDSSNSNVSRTENGKCSSLSSTPDSKKHVNGSGGGLLTKLKGKSSSSSKTLSKTTNSTLCSTDQQLVDSKNKKTAQLTDSYNDLFYQPVIQEENLLYRPVIIIGACKEAINATFLRDHSDEFGVCIPHTTRPRTGPEDIDGGDFYFVSAAEMDSLLHNHRLIETGRSGLYLYGTSLQAVLDVAESGRHCVLDISCAAVRRLCLSGLWPIVVLISVPNITELRALLSSCPNMPPTIDDNILNKQINKIDRLKHEYLPYITEIVSGSNFESVYQKVYNVITIHNGRKIWLPSSLVL